MMGNKSQSPDGRGEINLDLNLMGRINGGVDDDDMNGGNPKEKDSNFDQVQLTNESNDELNVLVKEKSLT